MHSGVLPLLAVVHGDYRNVGVLAGKQGVATPAHAADHPAAPSRPRPPLLQASLAKPGSRG